jgi:hypothetical protein
LKRNCDAARTSSSSGVPPSQALGYEIESYLRSRRDPRVFLIDFDGVVQEAIWWRAVAGLAITTEPREALASGAATPAVINRLLTIDANARQQRRVRSVTIAGFAVVATAGTLLGLLTAGPTPRSFFVRTAVLAILVFVLGVAVAAVASWIVTSRRAALAKRAKLNAAAKENKVFYHPFISYSTPTRNSSQSSMTPCSVAGSIVIWTARVCC